MELNLFPRKSEPVGDDCLLLQDANNNAYFHTKISDLNISDSSNTTAVNPWLYTTADTTIRNESIVCDTANNSITISITPPTFPFCLRIVNIGDNDVNIDLLGESLEGDNLENIILQLSPRANALLAFSNNDFGWIDLEKSINKVFTNSLYPGMLLWLEGTLLDLSGNGNHAIALGNAPTETTGIDGANVLQWNGSGTQELTIPYFLGGSDSATLYCVYTANSEDNYNLARTKSMDDYWRFVNGSGYFGTFLNNRINNYPASIPANGNHLVSIHASASEYEVILDNQSQGIRNQSYSSGDRFVIGSNDKKFKGQLAFMLVYPFEIDPASAEHQANLSVISYKYPSLNL